MTLYESIATIGNDLDPVVNMLRGNSYLVLSYANADAFLKAANRQAIGCLILGPTFPQAISDVCIGPPIVALCEPADTKAAVQAMKNGAFTVVELPGGPLLLEAVGASIRYEAATRDERVQRAEITKRFGTLSKLECQIIQLLLSGAANKVIANRLGIGLRTVELHRAAILKKMGFESVVELATIAGKMQISLR
jgi:FixJ family two-component response regulator